MIRPSTGIRWTCTSKIDRKIETRGRGVGSSPSSGGGEASSIRRDQPVRRRDHGAVGERPHPNRRPEEGGAGAGRCQTDPSDGAAGPLQAEGAEHEAGPQRTGGRSQNDGPAAGVDRRDRRADQPGQVGTGLVVGHLSQLACPFAGRRRANCPSPGPPAEADPDSSTVAEPRDLMGGRAGMWTKGPGGPGQKMRMAISAGRGEQSLDLVVQLDQGDRGARHVE